MKGQQRQKWSAPLIEKLQVENGKALPHDRGGKITKVLNPFWGVEETTLMELSKAEVDAIKAKGAKKAPEAKGKMADLLLNVMEVSKVDKMFTDPSPNTPDKHPPTPPKERPR